MAHRVSYNDGVTQDEIVEAEGFQDDEDWVDFATYGETGGSTTILRSRANSIARIDGVQ